MAAQLFTLPKQIAISSSFAALPGAKLYFYLSGTSTPEDTFTDADLSVAHTNPVVADASGVFAVIYLDPAISYKCELRTSADVLLYTSDPCNSAFPSSGQVNIASSVGGTANAITAALVPSISVYTPLMAVVFTPEADNTAATTFNLSGVGALPIQYVGGDALTGAELQEDHPALLILNAAGTAWELQNPYVGRSRGLEVGYRGMPFSTQSGNYTFVQTDNGTTVYYIGAGGHTFTLPATLTGNPVIQIRNASGATLAIAQSGSSLNWYGGAGSIPTGSRTLAIGGSCVADFTTSWSIVGTGLT